ncbi:MAG: hypothetical protein ACRDRU_11275 [Pseudonocardiaceae bacterium]
MNTYDGKVIRKRKVIPTTCSVQGVARGYTNLAVLQIGSEIVLDPHVTGGCVIVLDETAANALFKVLREWLSWDEDCTCRGRLDRGSH